MTTGNIAYKVYVTSNATKTIININLILFLVSGDSSHIKRAVVMLVITRKKPARFGYGPLKKYPITQLSKFPVLFMTRTNRAETKDKGIEFVSFNANAKEAKNTMDTKKAPSIKIDSAG